jgi:perosamine synthetase
MAAKLNLVGRKTVANRPPRGHISMSEPDISPEDIEAVVDVLNSKCLSLGPKLQRFEEAFADYVGTRYAVGVSSGTAGLHCAIRVAEIGAGDEVITTPFSFVASANCVWYERAKPVFVDIDEASLNMDPNSLPGAINDRTRAILPVHVFGQPCAMDEIMTLATRHRLLVIEDACEAIGSEYRGRKVGTFGSTAVFAFYPNKQMTTGEGGIITTDNSDIARKLHSLRNQGRDDMGSWLGHSRLGYNYRLGEINAALGISQLSRIEDLLARRQKVAAYYAERLKEIPQVQPLAPVETTTRLSWFVYVVRLDPDISKLFLIQHLADMGIPSRSYFTPIHLHPFYREMFGYKEGSFPVTERVARSTIALPFHANFSEENVDTVVDCLRQAIPQSAI